MHRREMKLLAAGRATVHGAIEKSSWSRLMKLIAMGHAAVYGAIKKSSRSFTINLRQLIACNS
jgi:hypothetical protein